jgi:type IV secretion system protein VirD4
LIRSLISVFGSLFFFFQQMIYTPILLGWMVGCMCLGGMIGAVIAYFVSAPFFGTPPGQTAWEWVIYGPLIFVGVVFGFQYWRMTSGADAFFGMNRDSHGSARFANRKELKKLEGTDGA